MPTLLIRLLLEVTIEVGLFCKNFPWRGEPWFGRDGGILAMATTAMAMTTTITGDKAEEGESEQVARLKRKKANRRQRGQGRKRTGDKVEDEDS